MYSYGKAEATKGLLTEVYYELSSNNLPCCEMNMMGFNGVFKTLV
jgi:hypothetical protein